MSDAPPPPVPPPASSGVGGQFPSAGQVPPPPPGGYRYGGIGYGQVPRGDAATPVDQPFYGAPIGEAWRRFWAKYATFSGRASRSEFWWMVLILWLISIVLGGFENHHNLDGTLTGLSVTFRGIGGLWSLATIVPSLALFWRRMHDTNRSGLNVFWWLLPVVGWIILLVLTLGESRPQGQRFDG